MFGRPLKLAVAATALVMSLTPSIAVTKHWKSHHVHHYARTYQPVTPRPAPDMYAQSPYSEAPPGSACIPMCHYDTSPCDPQYFKMADGRCNPAENGGFF